MANSNKTLVGFAMSSNSILQKIESLSTESSQTLHRIEAVVKEGVMATRGLAAAITQNTKVLTEIKNVLNDRKEKEKALTTKVDMKKLAGTAGLIAVAGLGIFTLSMAFAATKLIGPAEILKGIAIMATLIPISKAMVGVMETAGGLINSASIIKNMAIMIVSIAVMTLTISHVIAALPNINSSKLVTLIAITAVIYIQGTIFVKLMHAFKKGAIQRKDMLKFAMIITVLSVVLIPIALVSKAIGMLGITAKETTVMYNMAMLMIPIAILIGAVAFAVSVANKPQASPLGGMARSRGVKLTPRSMKKFAAIMVLTLITVGIAAVVATKVFPILKGAISQMAALDYTGLFKFILILGLATLLMGSAIAIVITAMKGGSSPIQGGFFGIGGMQKQKAGKITGKDILAATLIIPAIVIGIALAAIAWSKMMPDTMPEIKDPVGFLMFTLLAGLAINIFGNALGMAMAGMRKIKLKNLVVMTAAIPIIAFGILASAWILQGLPDTYKAPDVMWSVKIVIPLVVMGGIIYLSSKTIGKLKPKKMLQAAIGVAVSAGLVWLVGWMFSKLPTIWNTPPIEWSVNAGLGLIVFGALLYLSANTVGKLARKDMFNGMLGIAASAVSILIVAYIFYILPTEFIAPPSDWSNSVSVTLGLFGAAMIGLGALAKTGGGAVVIGLGLLAMIAGSLAILISSWILSFVPIDKLKKVAQGFTDIIMMPFNGIIDILARFKNDIGIDNMVSMGLGLAAIGGGLIVFGLGVAALGAGGATGSFFSFVGSLFDAGTSIARGKKVDNSPMSILLTLIANTVGILQLSDALKEINKNSSALITLPKNGISVLHDLTKIVAVDPNNLTANAASFTKIAKAYTRVAVASKLIDVDGINATTNMFKALNDLAYNKGENAMTVFAEKLMVAVKELSEVVMNLENAVENQNNSGESLISKVGNFIGEKIDAVTGKANEMKKSAEAAGEGGMVNIDLNPLLLEIQLLRERFDTAIQTVDITEFQNG